ncbi:MAG TPA: 3-hydroxybutyryl-CoA dehydrogenase [Mycobacteriales bacterium]|nr:3-hydroxybutyryl-CoA dehydrogenase [Mycobacteriales bacterium]
MDIRSVGVVGLGTMGAGIVEVFARAGLEVVAVEISHELLALGRSRLEGSLAKAVDRGKLSTEDRDAQLARVRFTTDRRDLASVDLVTEAVPERLEVKTALFAELATICPPSTVLATNTSSLPITEIARATSSPSRVVGMHFFNPAPVMRLVEVVHTVVTEGEVVDAVRDLASRCGKTPVVVGDRAGFVANALLFGYLNAAARAAETGQASVADIDAAVVASCGVPMGPLTLMDLIGLDVSLDVLETMFAETRDQRYAPAPLLRRLVMAGQLGRKSGRGYYRYDVTPAEAAVAAPAFACAAPRPVDKVVAVVGAAKSPIGDALASVPVVPVEDIRDADVVLVDGGSRAGTSELVARVAGLAKSGAVIAAATTDEAPVGTLAAGTRRAADIVGLHVPLAPRQGVVEVVATIASAPDSVATAVEVVRRAGLVPVACKDRPGHIVEMLVLPHLGDAVRMVDDGYAAVADVDAAMSLGCGYPDGPFAMLASVGADNLRSGLLHLAAATHLSSLAPAPLLDELAAFGPADARG